jgi:Protein of unknwon function (DUF3008)
MTFFYDLNKKLNNIRELPETTHQQLNERDMSRAAKGHEKYGKGGMQALAKAGREGKDLDKVRDKYNKYDESVEEGQHSQDAMALNPDFAKVGKKPGVMDKIAKGVKRVADFVAPGDEDLMRDLERKSGGRRPAKEAAAPMTPKQKSFAKLAPPADKITFADKIAGAKKEVDEMLGDVAAEAMKAALGKGKQPVRGMGEAAAPIDFDKVLDAIAALYGPDIWDNDAMQDLANDLEQAGPTDRELDFIIAKGKLPKRLANTQFSAGDNVQFGEATKEIPGGRRHTSEPGGYGRKDDEEAPKVQTQRGRGRPKKNADSETGQVMKPDWSAFGVGKVNLPKHKGAVTKHKMVGEAVSDDDIEVLERLMDEAFAEGNNTLGNAIQGVIEQIQGEQDEGQYNDDEQVNEKAVSKKQQKFMGMVHAAKKGEKPASKEVAKAAKGISGKEAEKFASTKHKGLPEKAEESDKADKKDKSETSSKKVSKRSAKPEEKVDETTTSGSVATAPAGGGKKSSGGFAFGGGIYDSMNRDLENMIAESMTRLDESMSINMSMNSESPDGQGKSLTITATGDDADKLAMMLKMAGMGGDHSHAYADAPDMVDENKPDWPTNTETSDDAFQYSGGLNKPKRDVAGDGQATGQVTAVSSVDDHSDDDLDRMMEMAGVKKAKPDFLDMDKDGDKKEPMKKAVDDKKETEVKESIFDLQRLWKAYKG